MDAMNEQEIVKLYQIEKWTLRRIAGQFDTDHHTIKRVLARHGVELSRDRIRIPFSEEHRKNIGAKSRGRRPWSKGLIMPESFCRANMKGRLRTAIDLDVYEDFGKLKHLTKLLAKRKSHLGGSDQSRKAFLDRFYFDEAFNAVYDAWIASGKNKWYYPSLDHKHAKSNGGNWALNNLQFITWFENRAKAEMSVEEWDAFRASTNTRSELFINEILVAYRKKGGSKRGED